jgi:hypothetical protein
LSTEVPSEKTEILLKMIYHKKVYLKEESQMYICIIVFSLITFVLHLSQRKTLYILSDLLIYPLRLYLVNDIFFVTFNNNKCFYLQLIGLNVSTVVGIVLMPKLLKECWDYNYQSKIIFKKHLWFFDRNLTDLKLNKVKCYH